MRGNYGKTILAWRGHRRPHIFPALAVAHQLRDAGWRVVWLGKGRHGSPPGAATRLRDGLGPFRRCAAKACCASCCCRSTCCAGSAGLSKAIRQVSPNVVLGMGGYITFPGGMMAAAGIPLVLHEQNSVAGLANRVLAGVADRVARDRLSDV